MNSYERIDFDGLAILVLRILRHACIRVKEHKTKNTNLGIEDSLLPVARIFNFFWIFVPAVFYYLLASLNVTEGLVQ